MKLNIATCQFAEDWNPRRNARIICRYIAKAKREGADVVHFHECALSGYGGKISSSDYDWAALRESAQSVLDEAARQRIWVVLGTSHPLTPPHRPHNSLYLISPQGRIVDRYDKRFCMAGDLAAYTPGDHVATFKLKGITCGLLICFDLRFPHLYEELSRLGVRVLFQSFHNGRFEGPGIHSHIMRQTLQAHAGIHTMWISAPNSSAHYSRWPSVFITPDGKIEAQLDRDRSGMMVNIVDTARKFYDPVSQFRDLLLARAAHSGRCVRDARSRDRQGL